MECSKSGYKGRVALYELFPMTREIKDCVLQGIVGSGVRDRALAGGMVPLLAHGMTKVREGVTTLEEVMTVASGAA